MNYAPHIHHPKGAVSMTRTVTSHRFGQEIDPQRLSPLARRMAAAIGAGTPAPWAGFAWHGPVSQHPPRRSDHSRPARAA
jgi:hypothetical protein